MNLNTLHLAPIGVIRTPFLDKSAAPRQPCAEALARAGEIVLHPGCNFEQALDDVSGIEFIWIVSWFHKNKNWKPKVLPPRGSKIKRGVFATRSPHRPNPIGLSLARLVEIKGLIVRVAETDLLDGTPILDLKPYLPFEEAHPAARCGWLEHVANKSSQTFEVSWSPLALEQAEWLKSNFGVELQAQVERVLSREIEPHPYRRISKSKTGARQLAVKSWRVDFEAHDRTVAVLHLRSGYSSEALTAPAKALHDEAAHRAFHVKWPASI